LPWAFSFFPVGASPTDIYTSVIFLDKRQR
jgi:hypothetical protein